MSVQWITRAGTLSLFILLAIVWQWHQQVQLALLRENNGRLRMQTDILQARVGEMKKREVSLSAALISHQQAQQRLDMNNIDSSFASPWYRHRVLLSLCLMTLSGCSATPCMVVSHVNQIPTHLLIPCPVPDFSVRTWGE